VIVVGQCDTHKSNDILELEDKLMEVEVKTFVTRNAIRTKDRLTDEKTIVTTN